MIKLDLLKVSLHYAVNKASEFIENGKVVAYPTETFYALGAKYNNDDALRRIYHIKKRPTDKVFPLIVGSAKVLEAVTEHMSCIHSLLIDKYWPGPLTILFQGNQRLSSFICSPDNHVAVRIPGESFAYYFSNNVSFPITATSANVSGHAPSTSPEMVFDYFGNTIDLLIDGGNTPGGLPSTIVKVENDGSVDIIRQGACVL
ncbi:MAG: threonylcarbamoyl-AMP synthase [Candidatus Magnetoovum sp. WYHC-5]|nr:threonylcarbamoyl-AMP synthase [Candidatus Magnetoovum sp. WYHC-5]